MEVNIIFQNESKIDENNSFDVEFRNEQEIIEFFFNQKRDYYLTNAVAYIENKVNYSKEIKDLEKIAKKHLDEEKTKKYTSLISDTGGTSYNVFKKYYDGKHVGFFAYKMNKEQMDLFKRTYKYLNTKKSKLEEFRVYDFLKHLREGVNYEYKHFKRGYKPDPYSALNLKLINNYTVVDVSLKPSFDQSLRLYIYEWNNTLFMKIGNRWEKSDSGWVFHAHKLTIKMKKERKSQLDINKAVGKLIANYLLGNEKALVMIHLLNYNKLNETEKKFVFIVLNSDRTARVNHKNNYFVCFSEKANFNIKKK